MPSPADTALGMILKGFPRISETFISNEIRLLEQLGLPIRIFSMRKARENFTHKHVLEIRAPVHYLPETLISPKLPDVLLNNLLLAVEAPRRYRRALRTAVRRFRRTRRMATWRHLLQAGYLVRKWLPGSRITHLHAHFAHSPTSVALFAGTLSGLPFSFTAHAKDIYTSDPRQLREKIAAARFVVTCTDYNRNHLENIRDADATPIYRIYHGIERDRFNRSRDHRQPMEPYRLLTVARLTRKKGIGTVIDALSLLKKAGMNFTYTLIGDGEDRETLLKRIDAADLSDRVRWLGTQPHEVVLDHYRCSDLFLIGCEVAENGDRDGIPNVLVESLAMGVPVVATALSAIPELIEDGRTGLLVPPGHPEALAEAGRRLLTDHDLRDRVVASGIQKVQDHFDNATTIRSLAAVFQSEAALPLAVPNAPEVPSPMAQAAR